MTHLSRHRQDKAAERYNIVGLIRCESQGHLMLITITHGRTTDKAPAFAGLGLTWAVAEETLTDTVWAIRCMV